MSAFDSLPESTDVVIVGAGPTGLTLACALAQEGVRFVLLDRLAEGLNTSRAAVVYARTLEVLDGIGVADTLRAAGHVVPQFVLRDRDRVLARIRFDALPTRYAHTLMIPQCDTEAILLRRLRALGGSVVRPAEVAGLETVDDGVIVTVSDGNGATRPLRARYVVGADGMHSAVRERAGIGFAGEAYSESFVLADVRMTWPLSPDEVMLFFSPSGLVVVAPLTEGRHRIVATMDDAPEHPDGALIQSVLDTRGPTNGRTEIHEILWSSRFHVHHRLADHYRAGRILLAGDAAHVHSPAGGQGMNTGIQDGIALGHALTDVLLRNAGEGRLDQYERARRPVAERVVSFTDKMTRMATLRSAPGRLARNSMLGVLGRIPAFRRRLATELSGLNNR
jgi:2-polyprenyl-6-methoxyphenol hydroxylase-like FAD-dependent oxidoreductase